MKNVRPRRKRRIVEVIYDTGWLQENADFLARVLTIEFVQAQLNRAALRLDGQPEHAKARQVVNDLPDRIELVESRTAELPLLLRNHNSDGWSV